MRIRDFGVLGFTFVLAVGIRSRTMLADEGGVGFWLPGHFGSLVAVHSAPGWAFPVIYNHPSAAASGTSFRRGANIGLNHWSADAGGAYTYFDSTNEFSAALGFTYYFENPATHYQNGVDSHFDWGASHFVSQPTHVGLVGYSYYQFTGDSGAGAVLGAFKSRVSAVGPQVGHSFGNADNPWYVNVKAYYEFGERYRAAGWNVWVTLGIP